MLLAVEKSLKNLRPGGLNPRAATPTLTGEIDVLAAWMEPRHTLLLRTLVDGSGDPVRLPGASGLFGKVGGILEDLRNDTRLKFLEFRGKWTSRLEVKALLPFLQRNDWFVPHPAGGITLAGRGMRKEARMLYLQTSHDMVSDCARQWGALAGRVQALQERFAAEWLAELPPENNFRIPAVLEATLRDAELQAWKSLRLSLGAMAEETFIRAVGRWDERQFADPETVVRDIASPWRKLDASRNGFIGFMLAMSALTEQLVLAMLDHYDRKWELFLRGFAEGSTGTLEREKNG